MQEFENGKADRQAIMLKLEERIQLQGDQLQDMQRDLSQLEELITGLKQEATATKNAVPFASMKGKLPWPSKGRLARSFGSSRNKGSLRWQGVILKAQAGTKIHAISAGRVVFADWFRNLGLLIIIDHGDGYMTLYGHNQSLYKAVGDTVESGELIATMGNTGGNHEVSLYFEIRDQGTPTNPARWCRPRNLSRS
jgi:septal ring factor EnvC (AmiA/AmiB activator)